MTSNLTQRCEQIPQSTTFSHLHKTTVPKRAVHLYTMNQSGTRHVTRVVMTDCPSKYNIFVRQVSRWILLNRDGTRVVIIAEIPTVD